MKSDKIRKRDWNAWDRRALGQDRRAGTAGPGLPGPDCREGTAELGPLGLDRRAGPLGRDAGCRPGPPEQNASILFVSSVFKVVAVSSRVASTASTAATSNMEGPKDIHFFFQEIQSCWIRFTWRRCPFSTGDSSSSRFGRGPVRGRRSSSSWNYLRRGRLRST